MIHWKKYYIVIVMMILGLMVSIYFMSLDTKFQSKLIEINKKSSDINIIVNDAYNERGIYILNNKYYINSATHILGQDYNLSNDDAIWRPKKNKYIPKISDISAPFEIQKEQNNDTLKLIKNNKTITLLLK